MLYEHDVLRFKKVIFHMNPILIVFFKTIKKTINIITRISYINVIFLDA